MDSRQVSQILEGISGWHPFGEQTVESVPKKSGVYVFRMARGGCFGRLRGESDIFYVGSAEGKRGLRDRLHGYLRPGPTQWTNKRVHEMTKKYAMEIAWCVCGEASNLELQLLHRYIEEHDELPPLNHASKALLKKRLAESEVVKDTGMVKLFDKEGSLIRTIEG